jgi:Protein of unknown function (DUF1579)
MFTTAITTKPQSPQPQLAPSPEHQLLNVFVGKWHTEGLSYGWGQSKENPDYSPVQWSSEETYEWLAGGFFLVYQWKGQIGDAPINGIEIIGYDAVSQTYPSRLFDNYGRIHLGHWSVRDRVWSYTGTEYRATYVFSDDGNTMTIRWEWLSEEDWFISAELKATKVE